MSSLTTSVLLWNVWQIIAGLVGGSASVILVETAIGLRWSEAILLALTSLAILLAIFRFLLNSSRDSNSERTSINRGIQSAAAISEGQQGGAASTSGDRSPITQVVGDAFGGNKNVTFQLSTAAAAWSGRDLLERLIEETQLNIKRTGASRGSCEIHFADLAHFHKEYGQWPEDFTSVLQEYRMRIQTGSFERATYFEDYFVPLGERLASETKKLLDSELYSGGLKIWF